jgi:HSP20 family protein
MEDSAMSHDSIRWMQVFTATAVSLADDGVWRPLVDIYRTADGWLIKYELAGVLPEDVRLILDGRRLILQGTRRDCSLEKGFRQMRLEISYSQFERTIELPDSLERACLTSEFCHGMLLVRVEKEASR